MPGDEISVCFMEVGHPLAGSRSVCGDGSKVVIRKKEEKEGKKRNKDGKRKTKHTSQPSSQSPHRSPPDLIQLDMISSPRTPAVLAVLFANLVPVGYVRISVAFG